MFRPEGVYIESSSIWHVSPSSWDWRTNPIQLNHGTCQRHTPTFQTQHLPLPSMLQIEKTSSFWTQQLILISLIVPHHFYSKTFPSASSSPHLNHNLQYPPIFLYCVSLLPAQVWSLTHNRLNNRMYERFSPHVFNNLSLFSSFTVLSNFSSLESNLLIPLLLSLLITKKKNTGQEIWCKTWNNRTKNTKVLLGHCMHGSTWLERKESSLLVWVGLSKCRNKDDCTCKHNSGQHEITFLLEPKRTWKSGVKPFPNSLQRYNATATPTQGT